MFGSATLSAPEPSGYGSLSEPSHDGERPFELAPGEIRRYLAGGDEVTLRAHARRDGFVPIGFGDCLGRISPA